ncbi:DUF4181 domain-containing protein [Microbacterium sp. APC 3898]|uniref:DUF4181 domain-containing protein n=1 Tax=Planococcus notacanthi TaxID=3035188 RepID=A0ABT7ZJP1_9BACL|nr:MULTISPECIES: DUF4181 domain-containing protein [Terrabacteria group]MDN3427369.1 DUF4181 domain-containing protein [Planococcus sp. APC 4016]MDN3499653.1 DUF4181 domain-containing protein [Microbacterium sp. APC 3898]
MFWLKVCLSLVILFAIMAVVKFTLRKIFKIEKLKKEWFSYNHVNKNHQKVDWFVRILSTIVLIAISYLVIFKEYSIIFYLIPLVLLMALDYSIRAFFEWKYSDGPKQAILTIGEMVVIATALALTIQYDLLKLGY